jgi:hypothetical protein
MLPAAITAAGPISPLKSLAIQFIGVPGGQANRDDSTVHESAAGRWLHEVQQNYAHNVTFAAGPSAADALGRVSGRTMVC